MTGGHLYLSPCMLMLSIAIGTALASGNGRLGHSRSLQQSTPCITSTIAGNYSGSGVLANDPLCLHVGDFSVPCPSSQPCACPTLGPVNAPHNLLGCFNSSQFYCSVNNSQTEQTLSIDILSTALAPGTGVSNLGVCWNAMSQTLSDFGTLNNALVPSAATVADAIAAANGTAVSPAASPAASPSSPAPNFANDVKNAESTNTGTILGIVFSIVGPTIAIALWLSITWSHREEKSMVLSGVVQHIRVPDISNNESTFISSTYRPSQQPNHVNVFANFACKLPFHKTPIPQSDTNKNTYDDSLRQPAFESTSDSSASLHQAAQESQWGHTTSEVHDVHLLHTPQLQASHLATDLADLQALTEVQTVARHITTRCLRRWDGFLAVRAGKDSLDRRKGVWKDKFESVRSAALLLAFRKVNATLQKQVLRAAPEAPEPPGSLMAAWQTGNSDERAHLVTIITKTLQDISEEEAQALHIKDPEAAGWHDTLSSILERCTCCVGSRQQAVSPRSLHQHTSASGVSQV